MTYDIGQKKEALETWISIFHLLIDVILVSGVVSFVLITRKLKKDEVK